MSADLKSVPIEELKVERTDLRRAAIHLAAMVFADASRSQGASLLSQDGALETGAQLDLETAAVRYAHRLDELLNGSDHLVH